MPKKTRGGPWLPLVFPLPLQPIYFLNSKQGNEQLRIDGDLYPCAL